MSVTDPAETRVGAIEIVSFLCELALLVAVAVIGAHLSHVTVLRWVLAILFPVVVAAGWGLTMAPRARRRLADPARLIVQIVLFLLVGAGLAWAGHPVWGLAFAVVAITAFGLTRRRPTPA